MDFSGSIRITPRPVSPGDAERAGERVSGWVFVRLSLGRQSGFRGREMECQEEIRPGLVTTSAPCSATRSGSPQCECWRLWGCGRGLGQLPGRRPVNIGSGSEARGRGGCDLRLTGRKLAAGSPPRGLGLQEAAGLCPLVTGVAGEAPGERGWESPLPPSPVGQSRSRGRPGRKEGPIASPSGGEGCEVTHRRCRDGRRSGAI